MTTTTTRAGTHRPAPPLPSTCDQHTRYTAGCPECQHHNRIRLRTEYRARAYGIHQPGLMPSIGAARRLQALACAGYEAVHIAALLGVSREQVRRWRTPLAPTISRRRHHDIAALTHQLADTPGPSRRSRTIAYRRGWAPLAAWDDIDNPDDTPSICDPNSSHDPRVLVNRVLTGRAPIDLLTEREQAALWRRWADQRRENALTAGVKSFARQFDISEHRARRIAAAAHNPTSSHAAPSRTNRKVA